MFNAQSSMTVISGRLNGMTSVEDTGTEQFHATIVLLLVVGDGVGVVVRVGAIYVCVCVVSYTHLRAHET